jgi:hypothetical protein
LFRGGNPNPMHFLRRSYLLLALALPAMQAVQAQTPSSAPSNPPQDQSQSQSSQSSAAQQSAGETQGQLTVQARIRLRREQRRATAIHDAYDHRWESYIDTGYLRFTPGPSRQRVTFYAWETGLTRFKNERLGYTLDGRGYFGTAYVGPNPTNDTRYAISQYDLLAGPVYRFYLNPNTPSQAAFWLAAPTATSRATRMVSRTFATSAPASADASSIPLASHLAPARASSGSTT